LFYNAITYHKQNQGDVIMNVRCPFCRTSFNLSREFVAQAVVEADEKKQKHVGVECIKCRKVIKVSVKQMRRFVPREVEEAAPEAAPD
jgi:uncharacterized protein with PIN domain